MYIDINNKKIRLLNNVLIEQNYQINFKEKKRSIYVYNWNKNELATGPLREVDPQIEFCVQNELKFGYNKNTKIQSIVEGVFYKTFNYKKTVLYNNFNMVKNSQVVMFKKFKIKKNEITFDEELNYIEGFEKFGNIFKDKFLISWNKVDIDRIKIKSYVYDLRTLLVNFARINNAEELLWMDLENVFTKEFSMDEMYYSFLTCEQNMTKWIPIVLYAQNLTFCPLSIFWYRKNSYNVACNYLKYKISQDFNCALPKLQRLIYNKTKINRFLVCPPKGAMITNKEMHMVDLDSSYPSVYLEYYEKSPIIAHQIHCKLIKLLLEEKRKHKYGHKRKAVKMLLNAYGFGFIGADQYETSMFPSDKNLMLHIVALGRKKMDQISKIFLQQGFEVIYGITDSLLLGKGSKHACLQIINQINKNSKWSILKYEKTFNKGFFLSCNDLILESHDCTKIIKGRIFKSLTVPKTIRTFCLKLVERMFLARNNKISHQQFLVMINAHHKDVGINWEQFYTLTKDKEFMISVVNNWDSMNLKKSVVDINLKNAFLSNYNISWKWIYNVWVKQLKNWFSENIVTS